MRMRNLLLIFAIVLFAGAPALAQETPPAPSTPPQPYIAAPQEPMNFSFFFEGGNYLGIQLEAITRENMSRYGLSAPRGVGISRVSEGSPAERAGLKKGDVITQFDGEPVTSTRKLQRLISEAAPEQTVRLTVSRNGSEQQMTATLGKHQEPSQAYRALMPTVPETPGVPRQPRAEGYAPELFALGFGNNRRVGITTTPLTKQLADFFGISSERGLLITNVGENSPASKAGLKAGDIVTEVNGDKIEDTDDFVRAVNRKEEGEVTLTIIRDKSQRTIKVTPERRQTPGFNLSEFHSGPMAKFKVNLPEIRILQAMPKIEAFAIPDIKNLVLPKFEMPVLPRTITVPRIKSLPVIPLVPYELD